MNVTADEPFAYPVIFAAVAITVEPVTFVIWTENAGDALVNGAVKLIVWSSVAVLPSCSVVMRVPSVTTGNVTFPVAATVTLCVDNVAPEAFFAINL